MPNAVIERRSVIRYAIIGEEAVIHANARIGDNPEVYEKNKWDIAVAGSGKEVAQNAIILPKEAF